VLECCLKNAIRRSVMDTVSMNSKPLEPDRTVNVKSEGREILNSVCDSNNYGKVEGHVARMSV